MKRLCPLLLSGVIILTGEMSASAAIKPVPHASAIGGMGMLIGMLFVAGLYFLPTIVAVSRKKQNSAAIFALNLLAGWTFIGWIVAIVWALTRDAIPQSV